MAVVKHVLGLMSGTSMDGIDIAALQTDGQRIASIGPSQTYKYDQQTKDAIVIAMQEAAHVAERQERTPHMAEIEQHLTLLHAKAVAQFKQEFDLQSPIDLLGFHGQTVFHAPERHMTIQLGDGALLAKTTGIDTIYDMRANDMVHGGQGAPLIPVYHRAMVQGRAPQDFPLCVVNIGGISNLTYIAENGDLQAFDCGPGNALIDQWVRLYKHGSFDKDGALGLAGQVDEHILQNYKDLPFFHDKQRLSLDFTSFQLPQNTNLSLQDGAATLAQLTAWAIYHAMQFLPAMPRHLIICGGGRKNRAIMQNLQQLFAPHNSQVGTAETYGFDGDAIEAQGWGFLAVRALYNYPLTYPSTTGCDTPVSGGILSRKSHND